MWALVVGAIEDLGLSPSPMAMLVHRKLSRPYLDPVLAFLNSLANAEPLPTRAMICEQPHRSNDS
jgi:hypothetical protein